MTMIDPMPRQDAKLPMTAAEVAAWRAGWEAGRDAAIDAYCSDFGEWDFFRSARDAMRALQPPEAPK